MDKIHSRDVYITVMNNFKKRPKLVDNLIKEFVSYSIDPVWVRHKNILEKLRELGVKEVEEVVSTKDEITKYCNSLVNFLRDYVDVKNCNADVCCLFYDRINDALKGKKVIEFLTICDVSERMKVNREALAKLKRKVKEEML